MDAAVTVEGLAHRYGDVDALRSVSLSVAPGEIVGLIGPNGAGKTTLVRAICGVLEPTAGSVTVFDRRPRDLEPGTIGLLPQAFSPPDRLTGRELIQYYADLSGATRSVDDVLAAVGMADADDRWYERLSGGQRRRLCVGTAIVNDPELVVLDEPTTGIDPAGRRRVWSLLERLRDDGRTVLVTTHDMAEAAALGDRVALLSDGELVAFDRPDALVDRHGGEARVRIEPTDSLPSAVLDDLAVDVRANNGTYELVGIAPDQLAEVIGSLAAAGISFRRITWEEPTLEDVYHELAGAQP